MEHVWDEFLSHWTSSWLGYEETTDFFSIQMARIFELHRLDKEKFFFFQDRESDDEDDTRETKQIKIYNFIAQQL